MTSSWPTDKVQLGYLPAYEAISRNLAQVTDGHPMWTAGAPAILEIGVANGGGMEMLRDVFGTSRLWGIDNNPVPREHYAGQGVMIGDQSDPSHPAKLAELGWGDGGKFALIVDDASHAAELTAPTLTLMWPCVHPSGYYVIEDWNYIDAVGNFTKLWTPILGHWLTRPSIDLRSKPPTITGTLDDIDSVTFRDGMIILRKRAGEEMAA